MEAFQNNPLHELHCSLYHHFRKIFKIRIYMVIHPHSQSLNKIVSLFFFYEILVKPCEQAIR